MKIATSRTAPDLNDWLQAEREIVLTPAAKVRDRGKEFKASVALLGITAGEIRVSAMPDAFVAQANKIYSLNNLTVAANAAKVFK